MRKRGRWSRGRTTGTILLIASGLLLAVPVVSAAALHSVFALGGSAPDPARYMITTNPFTAAYEGSVTSGTISKISGTWNAVGVACQPTLGVQQKLVPYLTIQGLGAAAFATLQIVCSAGSSTPRYSLSASFPDGTVSGFSVSVAPGDVISASITVHLCRSATGSGGTGETITMTDVTTELRGIASTCDPGYTFPPTFAGWGIGNGAGALAEFPSSQKFSAGTIVDSSVILKISQLSSLKELVMVDSSNFVTAEPSTLATTGTAFTITWVNST